MNKRKSDLVWLEGLIWYTFIKDLTSSDTWVYTCDLESEQQLLQWKYPLFEHPAEARQIHFYVTTMLILWTLMGFCNMNLSPQTKLPVSSVTQMCDGVSMGECTEKFAKWKLVGLIWQCSFYYCPVCTTCHLWNNFRRASGHDSCWTPYFN